MLYFVFVGGMIAGFIFALMIKDNTKTYGIMLIDHKNELCSVRMTSKELIDSRVKKVILEVDHNANLSREEQVL